MAADAPPVVINSPLEVPERTSRDVICLGIEGSANKCGVGILR